jgi:hypothetical protein
MEYNIIIESLGGQDLQYEIYRDVLCYIIKECLSEVNKNDQSHNIFESLH